MDDKQYMRYLILNTQWSPATVQCQVEKKLEIYNKVKQNPLLTETGLYDLEKVGKLEIIESCPSFEELMGGDNND